LKPPKWSEKVLQISVPFIEHSCYPFSKKGDQSRITAPAPTSPALRSQSKILKQSRLILKAASLFSSESCMVVKTVWPMWPYGLTNSKLRKPLHMHGKCPNSVLWSYFLRFYCIVSMVKCILHKISLPWRKMYWKIVHCPAIFNSDSNQHFAHTVQRPSKAPFAEVWCFSP
jgi:hypothetical protein